MNKWWFLKMITLMAAVCPVQWMFYPSESREHSAEASYCHSWEHPINKVISAVLFWAVDGNPGTLPRVSRAPGTMYRDVISRVSAQLLFQQSCKHQVWQLACTGEMSDNLLWPKSKCGGWWEREAEPGVTVAHICLDFLRISFSIKNNYFLLQMTNSFIHSFINNSTMIIL